MPLAVSKPWLGLLFAMLRLSAQTSHQLPNDASSCLHDPTEAEAMFKNCALQCLTLENYAKCNVRLLTSLLTQLEAEYFQSLDPQANHWIQPATAVRVALMIGLHRDPSHDPNVSVFEAEMLRRM